MTGLGEMPPERTDSWKEETKAKSGDCKRRLTSIGSALRGSTPQLVGYVKREWAKGEFYDLESRRCQLCAMPYDLRIASIDSLTLLWENSTKQSVVHPLMKFLRESKESGLPFRLLNLTFVQ